ncbi:MAG: hypothetical protein ACUVV6_05130 [Thermoplasmatota archaeon]
MGPDRFSKNERVALYGLVRHPCHSDRLLSEELGLKVSTVTAIRHRLRRAGAFRTVRIPMLGRLGCELLCANHIRLNILRPRGELLRAVRSAAAQVESIFYAIADSSQLLILLLCRSYTEAWADIERIHVLLAEGDALSRPPSESRAALLPLSQMIFIRFFDFSAILHEVFGLPGAPPEPALRLRTARAERRQLSRVERRVYYGLVCHPEMVDNALARKIGVTRQSVTRIRRRLEGEGLLATARVPDIRRLRPEILVFSHFELSHHCPLSARRRALEGVAKRLPAFLHVSGDREGIIMGLAPNFTVLQKLHLEVSRLHLERGCFREEPQLTLFAVKEMSVVKDLAFAPIVGRALEIED